MNKILFGAAALMTAMTLSATTFATVDGKNITELELAPLLNGVPTDSLNKLPAETKKHLIDRAIELQLLMDEAQKSGVEKDELFTKQLELAKKAIALRVYQEKQFQKIKVDAKEISDFYAQNKDKFVEPAQMKAKHILVKDENEAKEIIKELSNLKGADLDKKFTEIAKTKSIEPIASQSGGELGWFAAEQMVKPFSDAVSVLKKGEITKTPVKTQFGFHVILKEDAKDKKQLTQDDVKQFIEENIKQEKFQQHIKDEGKMLREKAKIEYK